MSNGKYTLITGGTEGIGYELSRLYAKDNHNLILVARNNDRLKNVKKELESKYGINVEIISLDLSIHNEREKLIKTVEEKNIVVDNLINNAGIGSFGEFSNN
ncbi:MAG: SDR family NAD(P)-dependent oxidoreductase, partial [Clostridium sp.]